MNFSDKDKEIINNVFNQLKIKVDELNILFSSFYEGLKDLRNIFFKKDDILLNNKIKDLQKIAIEISKVENERYNIAEFLKKKFKVKDQDPFSFVLSKMNEIKIREFLVENLLEEFKKAHLKLKFNIDSIQRAIIAIASILESKIVILNSILDLIYPDRKDITYSESGYYGSNNKQNIINYKF